MAIQLQQKYLDRTYPGEKKNDLMELVNQLPAMHPACRLAVTIPAYQEGSTIYRALSEFTEKQLGTNGQPIPADWLEINVLLNRPRDDAQIPLDATTREEVRKFQQEHPEQHVHLAEKTYAFEGKPIMGRIFKDIADAVIQRNLQRQTSEESARLVLRSSGADVYGLSPFFIRDTLQTFQDPVIAAYRSEARLPREILEKIPLLHVIQTLAVGLLRTDSHSKTSNGPLSYRAAAYARVGGFKNDLLLAEDSDLAIRLIKLAKKEPTRYTFYTDLRKHVLHDPRRQILALLEQAGIGNRYQSFGDESQELRLRDLNTTQWARHMPSEQIPEAMRLTPETLSREVSGYYRIYLRKISRRNVGYSPSEVFDATEKLFRRMFTYLGIRLDSYAFVRRQKESGEADGAVIFYSIDHLQQLIENRTFPGYKQFEHLAATLS